MFVISTIEQIKTKFVVVVAEQLFYRQNLAAVGSADQTATENKPLIDGEGGCFPCELNAQKEQAFSWKSYTASVAHETTFTMLPVLVDWLDFLFEIRKAMKVVIIRFPTRRE